MIATLNQGDSQNRGLSTGEPPGYEPRALTPGTSTENDLPFTKAQPLGSMVQTPVLRAGGAEEASNRATTSTAHPLL